LNKLRNLRQTFCIDTDKYRITGAPFYNSRGENEFRKALEEILEE